MANICKNLEADLINAGYSSFNLYDSNDFFNQTVKAEKANAMSVCKMEPYFEMNSIKLPKKKLVDINYILGKINKEKTFQNFTANFKELLKKNGIENTLNCYATTYGLGISIIFSYRGSANELKSKIDDLLNSKSIEFRNETSEAGWVFRYVISKGKENISRL